MQLLDAAIVKCFFLKFQCVANFCKFFNRHKFFIVMRGWTLVDNFDRVIELIFLCEFY